MSEQLTNATRTGSALMAIGAVPLAIGIIWAFFVGFEAKQLPVILILLAVGAGTAWWGQRMKEEAKRRDALDRIAARDAGQHPGAR